MRKFLYIIPVMALILGLASCSSSDDDEMIRHTLTVDVTLPEEVTKAEGASDLVVTAYNTQNAEKSVAQIVGTQATLSLTPGTYNLTVSGELNGFNLNGVQTGVQLFKDETVTIPLIATVGSSLIFKEVYFSGVNDFYFQDAFYEIYNNTDEVQYLDGIIMGVVDFGLPAGTWTKDHESVWMTGSAYTDGRYPLTSHVQCFPGNGTDYPIQPRTSIVVAANPINHSARELSSADSPSPVDLSKADWQLYNANSSPADTEVEGIPNMQFLWKTWGREMMPATEGQPIVLARLKSGKPVDYVADPNAVAPIPGGTNQCFMLPADCIILDAIDIVPASSDCHIKRIMPKDDAGMAWFSGDEPGKNGDYSGKSLRRKVAGFTVDGKAILKDTNNSSNDFIIGGSTPTPGVIPTVAD